MTAGTALFRSAFVDRERYSIPVLPIDATGKEWINENVHADAMWFGTALVVEHRYAWGLAVGMRDAGFELA